MRIAFFGTPAFTTAFLDVLDSRGYRPSLIVTNPDRPAGRGMTMTSPEPKIWAQSHDVHVLQPEKLDDAFFAELSQTPWDLFVVIAYGKIIPEQIINLPTHGTINVHYSLLPQYRGATPVESAILNGDTTTGVSIQHMRYKLDSGPILAQQELNIEDGDTTPVLRDKLNAIAYTLLVEVIQNLTKGTHKAIEQQHSAATFCHKITKEDGLVSLSDDPIVLYRKYRAYTPWPGLYFFGERNGKPVRVKITKAHWDGTFVIDEVIPEGKNTIPYSLF